MTSQVVSFIRETRKFTYPLQRIIQIEDNNDHTYKYLYQTALCKTDHIYLARYLRLVSQCSLHAALGLRLIVNRTFKTSCIGAGWKRCYFADGRIDWVNLKMEIQQKLISTSQEWYKLSNFLRPWRRHSHDYNSRKNDLKQMLQGDISSFWDENITMRFWQVSRLPCASLFSLQQILLGALRIFT